MTETARASFREIRLGDQAVIAPILKAGGKLSCEYVFPNLFMWAEIFKLRWLLDRGLLLLHSARDDVTLMPVGKPFGIQELLAVSDRSIREGGSGDFALFDTDYVEKNPRLSDSFEINLDPANADYVYSVESLCELKGNKLHRKKNLLSQFLRNNPDYSCEDMDRRYFHDCFTLAEKWCRDRLCKEIGFAHETSALKRGFDNFQELGLQGIAMRLNGNLAAFSIFSELNQNTADVHFEKYDPRIKGAAQAINWETARRLRGKYKYINREQDLGIEGLRRSKKSYLPEFMIASYVLRRRRLKE